MRMEVYTPRCGLILKRFVLSGETISVPFFGKDSNPYWFIWEYQNLSDIVELTTMIYFLFFKYLPYRSKSSQILQYGMALTR